MSDSILSQHSVQPEDASNNDANEDSGGINLGERQVAYGETDTFFHNLIGSFDFLDMFVVGGNIFKGRAWSLTHLNNCLSMLTYWMANESSIGVDIICDSGETME